MQCAVCLDDLPESAEAQLPCCTVPRSSTTRFCRRCIEIICEHGTAGVGRCPNCRSYMRVGEGGELERADRTETCTLCHQPRVIVQAQGQLVLCDACALGSRFSLRYECEGCRRMQRIPHPMWRYQPTPSEFGNVTWHCHQRCNAFTHWRVAPQDANLVPSHDAPESWGRREEWLAHVREQRQREARGRGRAAEQAAQLREGLTLVLVIALLVATGGSASLKLLILGGVVGFAWVLRRLASAA